MLKYGLIDLFGILDIDACPFVFAEYLDACSSFVDIGCGIIDQRELLHQRYLLLTEAKGILRSRLRSGLREGILDALVVISNVISRTRQRHLHLLFLLFVRLFFANNWVLDDMAL